MIPTMDPSWCTLKFGKGLGLTCVSHLGVGVQERLASTASSTGLGKVDMKVHSSQSGASGTKISHPVVDLCPDVALLVPLVARRFGREEAKDETRREVSVLVKAAGTSTTSAACVCFYMSVFKLLK